MAQFTKLLQQIHKLFGQLEKLEIQLLLKFLTLLKQEQMANSLLTLAN